MKKNENGSYTWRGTKGLGGFSSKCENSAKASPSNGGDKLKKKNGESPPRRLSPEKAQGMTQKGN